MPFTADYEALRRDVGAVRVARDVVRASGPESASFLEGQLSQEIATLAVGAGTWALLLEPNGKVNAWLRVTRTSDEEFVLDLDAGFGDALHARLSRFKLRTRCELESLDWRGLAVRGPRSADVTAAARAPRPNGNLVQCPIDWPGLPGFDLLGEAVDLPDGVRSCGLDAYEAVRIEAGIPRLGVELTSRTMPHEAGKWLIDASVSFTKGCYTGQELVARVESRGARVPRQLRGVVVADVAGAADGSPPPGADVQAADGARVGTLTSVAPSPERGRVALAAIARAVEPPADVRVVWQSGEARAQVEDLPLVRS